MTSERQKEIAFQAWVERKNIEQKEARAIKEREREKQQQFLEHQRLQGEMAYRKWLSARLLADEEIHRDLIRQRQRRRLLQEEREKRMRESEERYTKWKERKDEEIKISKEKGCRELREMISPTRAETPGLPGYCSVWSCDGHMTNVMLSRVKRPRSYSLTDISDYIQSHDNHMTS